MGAARWPGWLERRREGVDSEGFTLPSSIGSASLKLTATAHWKATSCRVCIVWRLRPCMLHMRKHKIHHRSVGFNRANRGVSWTSLKRRLTAATVTPLY